MSAVIGALIKGSISNSYYIVDSEGNKHTPSAVLFYYDFPSTLYIIIVDYSSSQYTASSVVYYANSLPVFSLPVNAEKLSSQSLFIVVKVTVTSSSWDSDLVQDFLYAMMGYVYKWSFTLYYKSVSYPVEGQTTKYCNTTSPSTTESSVSPSLVTTYPSTFLEFSDTLGACSRVVPVYFVITDSNGNANTTQLSAQPSPLCGPNGNCTTVIAFYLSA